MYEFIDYKIPVILKGLVRREKKGVIHVVASDPDSGHRANKSIVELLSKETDGMVHVFSENAVSFRSDVKRSTHHFIYDGDDVDDIVNEMLNVVPRPYGNMPRIIFLTKSLALSEEHLTKLRNDRLIIVITENVEYITNKLYLTTSGLEDESIISIIHTRPDEEV